MKVTVAIPRKCCMLDGFASIYPRMFDSDLCLGCSFFRMCKVDKKPEYSDCEHWISDMACAIHPERIPENDCEYCVCWAVERKGD